MLVQQVNETRVCQRVIQYITGKASGFALQIYKIMKEKGWLRCIPANFPKCAKSLTIINSTEPQKNFSRYRQAIGQSRLSTLTQELSTENIYLEELWFSEFHQINTTPHPGILVITSTTDSGY